MASAHVIEVGEITAGIVVLEHGGFRFFASERAFHPLDSPLTKSAWSESIVCGDRAGVRLWRWVGRAIVRAT